MNPLFLPIAVGSVDIIHQTTGDTMLYLCKSHSPRRQVQLMKKGSAIAEMAAKCCIKLTYFTRCLILLHLVALTAVCCCMTH